VGTKRERTGIGRKEKIEGAGGDARTVRERERREREEIWSEDGREMDEREMGEKE
jgi:hypothetical protein